ncbi:MAG: hypothetical protein HQL76_13725 [Magnetococcales bacterium]|nr:hypothetical protein [Magnetococcales bacterium]
MSNVSTLAVLSLAGAMFVGSSFTAATPAKADVVTATILAGSALGLTLWHDPWPVRALVRPIAYVLDVPNPIKTHTHCHGYYGHYDHYVHVGVQPHCHSGIMATEQTPAPAAK